MIPQHIINNAWQSIGGVLGTDVRLELSGSTMVVRGIFSRNPIELGTEHGMGVISDNPLLDIPNRDLIGKIEAGQVVEIEKTRYKIVAVTNNYDERSIACELKRID